MKQLQTNKKILAQEHKQRIASFKKSLCVFAETIGKENGETNKPDTEDEMMVYAGNKIKHETQAVIYENHNFFSPISGMVLATEIRKEGSEKEQKLQAELSDVTLQQNQVEARKQETVPDKPLTFKRRLVYFALTLLGTVEGLYAFKAFRSKSYDMLTSICTGIGLGLVVSICTHYAARWCRHAERKLVRTCRILVSLILPLILFFAIAHIRADGYATDRAYQNLLYSDISAQGGNGTLELFLISYVFYLAAFFLSYVFAKSKQELQTEKEHKKACGTCKDLSTKANNLKVQIDRVHTETRKKSREALENFEQAVASEREIVSVADIALQCYIEKNLRYRSDGVIPPFFSHPQKFQFTTFFTILSPKTYEYEH